MFRYISLRLYNPYLMTHAVCCGPHIQVSGALVTRFIYNVSIGNYNKAGLCVLGRNRYLRLIGGRGVTQR